MIRLKMNDLTKNLTGYEHMMAGDKGYKTDIVLNDDEIDWKILQDGMTEHNAYYEGGALVKGEPDTFFLEELESRKKVNLAFRKVENEHTILIDNLISGMSMEMAAAKAKANREELKRLQAECEKLLKRQKDKVFQYHAQKNREAESELTWKYYSAAVLLIRDENRYLTEWIHWHLGAGFDHLYIYDNGDNESVVDRIPENMADGITVEPWHGDFQNVQEEAYNHFLGKYKAEARWVNFIDSDEFIRFTDTSMTVNEFLKKYEDYTEIYVGFTEYNASGRESYEEMPVRERFTTTTDVNENLYHKDFVQTNRVDLMNRHYPRFGDRGNYIYRNGKDNKDLVVVEHYYTKSWQEWQEKIARGSSDPNYLKQLNEFFVYNPDMAYLKTENGVQQYKN